MTPDYDWDMNYIGSLSDISIFGERFLCSFCGPVLWSRFLIVIVTSDAELFGESLFSHEQELEETESVDHDAGIEKLLQVKRDTLGIKDQMQWYSFHISLSCASHLADIRSIKEGEIYSGDQSTWIYLVPSW